MLLIDTLMAPKRSLGRTRIDQVERYGAGWTISPLRLFWRENVYRLGLFLVAAWSLSTTGCSQAVDRQQLVESVVVESVAKELTRQTAGQMNIYNFGGLCVLAGLAAGVLLTVSLRWWYRRTRKKMQVEAIRHVHKPGCN